MNTEQLNDLLARRPVWVGLAKRKVPLDVAEDMVQDALVKAINSEAEVLDLHNWFVTILINQCRSWWRKQLTGFRNQERQVRMLQLLDGVEKFMMEIQVPEEDWPDMALGVQEEKQWLHLAIGRLPNAQIRQVLFTYCQTGEIDRSTSTDKTRLHRGIKQLRQSAIRAGLLGASAPGQPAPRSALR